MKSKSTGSRALVGYTFSVSASEPEDAGQIGFSRAQVNRTVVRILSTLLGQGARVILGHDWRDDGVMDRVLAYVERYEAPAKDPDDAPYVLNLLPWNERSTRTKSELKRMGNAIKVENASYPTRSRPAASSRALRSLSYTQLRIELTQRSDARICIGGKVTGYQGRFPGVVEEALMSLVQRKPLYLIGLMGGATERVIAALQGKGKPSDLVQDGDKSHLQEAHGMTGIRPSVASQRDFSETRLFGAFRKAGLASISRRNGLSLSENRRLFSTESLDEALGLVLVGSARLRSPGKIRRS